MGFIVFLQHLRHLVLNCLREASIFFLFVCRSQQLSLIFNGTRFGGTKAPQLGLPNMSGLEPSKWKSGGEAVGTLKIVLFSHCTLGCVLGIIEWLPVVFSTEFMSRTLEYYSEMALQVQDSALAEDSFSINGESLVLYQSILGKETHARFMVLSTPGLLPIMCCWFA
jgi:hypothetical protein